MFKFGLIFLVVFMMGSCTTRIIKKEKAVEIRDVEVESKEPGVEVKIDLADPYEYAADENVLAAHVWDSTLVEITVPKKVVYAPKMKTIKLNKNTSVDVKVSATMDSGKIDIVFDVPKVAYQESTIVETTETDTSPSYTRWIIIIAILAFIAIIIIVIRK